MNTRQIGLGLIAIGALVLIAHFLGFLSVVAYQKTPNLCVGAKVDNIAWDLGASEFSKIKLETSCSNLASAKVKVSINRVKSGAIEEVYYTNTNNANLATACANNRLIRTSFYTATFDRKGDWYFRYTLYDSTGKQVFTEYKTLTVAECAVASSQVSTCSDGTIEGMCSKNQPLKCYSPSSTQPKGLYPASTVCGCPSGQKVTSNGQCVYIPTTTPITPSSPQQPSQPAEPEQVAQQEQTVNVDLTGQTPIEGDNAPIDNGGVLLESAIVSASTCQWYEWNCKASDEQTAILIGMVIIGIGLGFSIFGNKLGFK